MSEPAVPRIPRYITKPPIKRILKKAGIIRIARDVDKEIYDIVVEYTQKILFTTLVFTDHAPRKTIQLADLLAGLRKNNQNVVVDFKKPTNSRPGATGSSSSADDSVRTQKRPLFPGQEIPFNNFKDLCKSLVKEKGQEYRFAAWVFAYLQYAAESYTYELAILAKKCAFHANQRKTIRAADFRLARELRGW